MFNDKYSDTLEMFNMMHIITLVFLFGLLIGTIYLAKRWKNDEFKNKVFRYSLGSALLIGEVWFHIWIYLSGTYTVDMIPLFGFCALTNVLTIIMLFTNNKKLANMIIYYAFTGMIFSVIFIDISYGFPHFRYFHYFLIHFGFFLASVYNLAGGKLTISKRNFNESSLYLISYTLVMLVIDVIFDKNYFYLKESPVKEISDFFGPYVYTILWIITIYLLVWIWHLIFMYITKKQNADISTTNKDLLNSESSKELVIDEVVIKEEIVIEEIPMLKEVESTKDTNTLEDDLINIRYNYSFDAHLNLAPEESKDRYDSIISHIMSYPDIKVSNSWKYIRFKYGVRTFAKVTIQGKTITIYLDLDPKLLEDTVYNIVDESSKSNHKLTPTMFKVRGPRGVKHTNELIDLYFKTLGVEIGELTTIKTPKESKTREELVQLGLIKISKIK